MYSVEEFYEEASKVQLKDTVPKAQSLDLQNRRSVLRIRIESSLMEIANLLKDHRNTIVCSSVRDSATLSSIYMSVVDCMASCVSMKIDDDIHMEINRLHQFDNNISRWIITIDRIFQTSNFKISK